MIGLGVRVRIGAQQHRKAGPAVFDDFNRPNNATSLGSTKTGQVWEVPADSAYGIQEGRAYLASYLPDKPEPIASVDAGVADCVIAVEFFGGADYSGTHPAAGIAARVDEMGNHIRFYPDVNHFRIGRREGGALSVMGSNNSVVPANGQILKMILSGPSIRCYADDTLIFDVSSTLNLGVTKHGFYLRTMHTPTRWDNFRVEVLT